MITIKEHINNLVKANAKHIAELKSEEEVKDWLNSLLWSVVGFKNSISEEELDKKFNEFVNSDDFKSSETPYFYFTAGYKKAKNESTEHRDDIIKKSVYFLDKEGYTLDYYPLDEMVKIVKDNFKKYELL